MASNATSLRRNRLDHLLPQGYLAGFGDPGNDGKLWVYDCRQQRWFETGTRGVGAIRGFYDYSEGVQPEQTADEAFEDLESQYPTVRRELIASRFTHWEEDLNFLLSFAQMLRVRSQLFREHDVGREREIYTVVEVLDSKKVKVEPYVPKSEQDHGKMLRNMSITNMRSEIAKGADWMARLHWCLRFTTDASEPVITGDNAVVVQGKAAALSEDVFRDPETLVIFPICSQACLFGSPAKFDMSLTSMDTQLLRYIRSVYLQLADRFVFSPVRLRFEPKGV